MIMRDILLTSQLDESGSISVNMQTKLLYTINNWVINDNKSLTPEDLKYAYLSSVPSILASSHSYAPSHPSFTLPSCTSFSKFPRVSSFSTTVSPTTVELVFPPTPLTGKIPPLFPPSPMIPSLWASWSARRKGPMQRRAKCTTPPLASSRSACSWRENWGARNSPSSSRITACWTAAWRCAAVR